MFYVFLAMGSLLAACIFLMKALGDGREVGSMGNARTGTEHLELKIQDLKVDHEMGKIRKEDFNTLLLELETELLAEQKKSEEALGPYLKLAREKISKTLTGLGAVLFAFLGTVSVVKAQHGIDADLEAMLKAPQLSSEQEDPTLSAGTVCVSLVDSQDEPMAFAPVRLGMMTVGGAAGGTRQHQEKRADITGEACFDGLNSEQAYRVTHTLMGKQGQPTHAKTMSAPFRLPEEHGMRVVMKVHETTQDDRALLLVDGLVVLVPKDERLKVHVQWRLSQMRRQTYVFPKEGLKVKLPKGYKFFNAEQTMGDQKLEEMNDIGFRIMGSIPPGTTILTFSFDVTLIPGETSLELENPFRTFGIQAVLDAPAPLTLSVEGFPKTDRVKNQEGRIVQATAIQRQPDDAPLKTLSLVVRGAPGPSPIRWVGVAVAGLFLLAAFVWKPKMKSGTNDDAARAESLWLDRAKTLHTEHTQGTVGPETYAKEMAEIEVGLAKVLQSNASMI